MPAAIAGGLYYCLAGIGHVLRAERNAKEQLALVSDLAIFVLLAIFVASHFPSKARRVRLGEFPLLPLSRISCKMADREGGCA